METHFLGQVTLKAVLRYGRFFVLVREMNDNKWILPGGRMNVDEDPESGLAREINEELSVDATVGDIISVGAYHGGQKSKTPKLFVFYSAIVSPNQELVTDKKEIVEFALVSQKEELEKYPMHENQR
ncbi:MAG: NUDIX hydrolase, partial [Candidatus Paceibacterota bacterium]